MLSLYGIKTLNNKFFDIVSDIMKMLTYKIKDSSNTLNIINTQDSRTRQFY